MVIQSSQPSSDARVGRLSSSTSELPKPGKHDSKHYDIWLAVRVSVCARSSGQAEQMAVNAIGDLVVFPSNDAEEREDGRASEADGHAADGHAKVLLPPLVFNEIAVHILNQVWGAGQVDQAGQVGQIEGP